MKKIFILLFITIIAVGFLSSCKKENGKTVISVLGESPVFLEEAAEQYNKNHNEKIVIKVGNKADFSTAAIVFDLDDYNTVKEKYQISSPDSFTANLYDRRFAATENGKAYALPLFCDCGVFLYNKDIIKETDITDFDTLKSAIYKTDIKSPLALAKEDLDLYSLSLSGGTVYFELEMSDDYSFTPFAYKNAQKTALRYGENLKSFVDFFKDKTHICDTRKEAINSVTSGDKALTFIKTSYLDKLPDGTSLLPFLSGEGEDKKSAVFIYPTMYFSFLENKSSKTAEDFFEFLFYSDTTAKNYHLFSPYKKGKNGDKAMESLIKNNDIIILSKNARKDFQTAFFDIIKDYSKGFVTWDEAEKRIKSAF